MESTRAARSSLLVFHRPRLRTLRSKSLLGYHRQLLGARNHFSGMHRDHSAVEIIARGGSFFSLRAFENSSLALLFHILRSTALLGRPRQTLGARRHGSGVFRSYLVVDCTSFFHLKSVSQTLCFELCIVSSCDVRDFTGPIRRHSI